MHRFYMLDQNGQALRDDNGLKLTISTLLKEAAVDAGLPYTYVKADGDYSPEREIQTYQGGVNHGD